MSWAENLKKYDAIVAKCEHIERKGKTMPYTSANGHMFSLLNKAGELGFRYSKEDQTTFMETHQTTLFKSYGAVMRGYVLIPDAMLDDPDTLAAYLQKSHAYVMSLPPK